MQFDTLIFDLDGTLSDPKLGIVRSMNYALTSFDYPPRAEADIVQHIGPPLEESMQKLTESSDAQHIDDLVVKYRERYFEVGYTENELYSGVIDMLSALSHKQIPMGVCTSKHKTVARKIIERFEIGHYFDFIDGPTGRTTKAKQLSQFLLENIISIHSIMIGDRFVDISAAKTNSLASAGVLWGYGSSEELSAEVPDYIFTTPLELAQTFSED